MHLLISIGPLCLCSWPPLGRSVGAVLLALTLLKLGVLGGCTLARTCSRQFRFGTLVLCAHICINAQVMRVSHRIPAAAPRSPAERSTAAD